MQIRDMFYSWYKHDTENGIYNIKSAINLTNDIEIIDRLNQIQFTMNW